MEIRRAVHWKICADPDLEGLEADWPRAGPPHAVAGPVPGIIQQVYPDYQGVAWYWCEVAPLAAPAGHRALVRFESVDYAARVWMNGHEIGGHEGDGLPFELDATEFLEPGRTNLLAVRVINPGREPIDGLVLGEVPHSNKVPADEFRPGWGYNTGGIVGEVVLHVEPPARLLDVVVRPSLWTGVVEVDAVVSSAANSGPAMCVDVLVSEDGTGLHVAHAHRPVDRSGAPDEPISVHLEAQIALDQVRRWDIDDPFLYLVRVRLGPKGAVDAADETTVRTGFRELRVRDGWFELNGRRIYLRATHTGNHYPIGQTVPQGPALVRQDLVYAKAAGFNTVRFIAGVAREDQLDFCDALGLMVYEETRAAWLLGDSPRMGEHFDRSCDEMVRRDRNHPSVVIWGLLNETYDGPVFRHAVGYLPRLRQLDDTRLVLLSSGRWDGDLSIGSVCNPGQTTWEHEWGSELEGAPRVDVGWAHDPDRGAFVAGAGDVHLYPRLPESTNAKRLVRELAAGSKPVFLSEYGVGSLFDAVTALAEASCHLGRAGAATTPDGEPPDVAYVRTMAERFMSDWERFGMDELYCFPDDAMRESQLHQSLHRSATFDLIRANGNIAGYNLTGMLDHALTGEGPWTYWRRWKPSAMEVTADGWSPLRWCLEVEPAVCFPGDEIELGLSLANEDSLSPGDYDATVAIVGPDGWRWQRSVDFSIGHGRIALAVPVLQQGITLDGPPGNYRCAASLGTTAAPAAGRLSAEVIAAPGPLTPRRRAAVRGLHNAESRWLSEHGIDATIGVDELSHRDLFLIGHSADLDEDDWVRVNAAVDRGATALLLAPWELIAPGEASAVLPFRAPISCESFHDWLYHKECFARDAGLVAGLQQPGLMDWRRYDQILPRHMLHGETEDVLAFAIAVGFPRPGGYASGLIAASFRQGPGRVVVTTLDLVSHLGSLAVADQLTNNLLRFVTA